MTRKIILLTTLILATMILSLGSANASIGDAEKVVFARYPAPSPDGTALAFSWAGNIWTVPISGGRAARLTASDGYDWMPVWSPDGSHIAFMSDRYGSEDIFIMNADGGTPERITFASNNDILSGWTSDGSGLLFSSRRGGPWPNHRGPHIVDIESSRGEGPSAPVQIIPCAGYQAVMHPNGDSIAFHFGPGNGYREGYRGTHKEDIWIYRISDGGFIKVTENDAGNTDPQWSADGSMLYYRSEENGVGNFWSWNPVNSERKQITHLNETGLWHPKIGGGIVAYEWMGGIYVQNLNNAQPREIQITAWLDEDPDTPEILSMTSGATEYALSPDGKETALVVRGEIFCVRTDGVGGTVAARLTDHPARDWEISWYPRGDAILFTSDRDGIEQLYRVTSDDPDRERLSECRRFKIERLINTDEQCARAVIAPVPPSCEDPPSSPDDILIAYIRGRGDLWLMDGNGNNHRKLFSQWGTLNFSFSPDARWLAYSRQDDNYNVDIFIAATDPDDPDLPPCPSDGWQPFPGMNARGIVPSWADGEVNISRHPDDDWMPVWSPDGTKLGFTSVRFMDNIDAYFIFLKQTDEERSIAKWEAEADPLPPLPEPASASEEDDPVEEENESEEVEETEEEEPFLVDIDFENIHRRARRLTSGEGYETLWAFSPDGEDIVYTSETGGASEIHQVRWTGENVAVIAGNTVADWINWHTESDRIFYLANGRISSIKPGGGDSQTHSFRADINLDPLTERMYKFNEVWRMENIQYYDPEFHGQDWNALRDEYEPIVRSARHYRDFNDAVNTMMGRLNSSHLYFRDAASGPSAGETGYLGCGFVEDDQPGLLIDWITPHSPLDYVELGIETGDRIVHINSFNVGGWYPDTGSKDGSIANYWRALEDTVGREIEIGIIDSDPETGWGDNPRWVRVTPLPYWGWYQLAYEDWMADNRRMVDELSAGRLGYIHVPRMYEGQLERFEQDLFTVGYGKEGIIIDVRWNSGGWVSDMLLTMLNTRRHAYTQPRDGGLGYPEDRTPFYTTDVPIVVVTNQWSYSNAEVFSHAIKNLRRGRLVGWETGGGVISTGGTTLADGSYLSLPRRGWWAIDPDTGEILYDLEGSGAVPDILIDLLPSDIAAGDDPQLAASIKALLEDLGCKP